MCVTEAVTCTAIRAAAGTSKPRLAGSTTVPPSLRAASTRSATVASPTGRASVSSSTQNHARPPGKRATSCTRSASCQATSVRLDPPTALVEHGGEAAVDLRRAHELLRRHDGGRRGEHAAVELVHPVRESPPRDAPRRRARRPRSTAPREAAARAAARASPRSRPSRGSRRRPRPASAGSGVSSRISPARRTSASVSRRGSNRVPIVRGFPVSRRTGAAPTDSSQARPSSSRSTISAWSAGSPDGHSARKSASDRWRQTTPLERSIEPPGRSPSPGPSPRRRALEAGQQRPAPPSRRRR